MTREKDRPMRATFVTAALVVTFSSAASAQVAAPGAAPAPGYAPAPAPAPAPESPYSPAPLTQPATTHPQPAEYRVWRLVDPTEADWHAADPNRPRGWFRFDTDARGANFYVGGSFRLANGLAFAPFAHLTGTVAEPNLALTLQSGGLWVMPAFGTSLDFGTTRTVSLDPQLFVALDAKLLYLEGWAQYFVASALHSGSMDVFAARAMLLVSVSSFLGVGLEYDPTVATSNGPASSLLSSIFGGRVNLRIGDHDTLALFVGYQTAAQARGAFDGVAGRFEYVHQW
jgi:hypothetical protein